jgi:O-antigen ligase
MGEPLPRTRDRAPARRSGAPRSPQFRATAAGGWDPLLVCAAVYIATAVGRVHQLFPALLLLKPTMVAAALAVALYVLQQSGARRIALLRSRATTCLLALLIWAAVSVPGALNQGVAFRFFVNGLVKSVVMCLVVAGSVRSVRDVERLALVYFVATVVYAAVVLSRFQLGSGHWRLNNLYDYDANDFATLIATAIPLGLYFVLGQRRLLLRALAIVGLVTLGVGEIESGSRGGFLAVLAVVAFVLLRFTTVPARARWAGLALILAVVLTTASDRYWVQMQTILSSDHDYNATSEEGRLKIWERGLTYMTAHPVLGVGVSNFQTAEGTISPLARRREYGLPVHWGAAHNSFVQVGAELGIPGLACFVGLIASVAMSLRRVTRRALATGPYAVRVSRLAQGLMGALVGFVVGGFFLSLAYSDILYTLAALTIGLAKIARRLAAAGAAGVPR